MVWPMSIVRTHFFLQVRLGRDLFQLAGGTTASLARIWLMWQVKCLLEILVEAVKVCEGR